MVKKVLLSLVFALLVAAALHGAAAAQEGVTGQDVLLSEFFGPDAIAELAYNNGANQFLVVWSHNGFLYGQLYDAQGVPIGDLFAIPYSGAAVQFNPAAAYSIACDCYLVVWEDLRNGSWDIYGQRVDADGTLLGSNIPIFVGDDDQYQPDIASDGTNFLVAWHGPYLDGTDDVYGRFVDNGGALGPVNVLSAAGSTPRSAAAIAYNFTANEYLVVFQYGAPPNGVIYGRRVAPTGIPLGSEYLIADRPNTGAPDVASAAWGAYVVVWYDESVPSQGYNVYGQVVLAGADNSFDGTPFAISTAPDDQTVPVITSSPTSGWFLVVWEDWRTLNVSGNDIYGQRLIEDANPIGTNFAVGAHSGDQYAPAVIAGGSPNQVFVAWSDSRTGLPEVRGQRVAWNGSLLWYDFTISAQQGYQGEPAVAYNPEEKQYLAAWASEDGSIYVRRLNTEGQPREQAWVVESNGTNGSPAVAYNSTRNHYMVVFADFETERIELRIVYPAGNATAHNTITNSDHGASPAVAYDPVSDLYLVVWEAQGDIFGFIVDGSGSLIGSRIPICTESHDQDHPDVAFDPVHERFLVTWDDDRAGTGRDIYVRLVWPDGSWGDEVLLAGGSDTDSRARPALDFNGDDGEYLVVYHRQIAPENRDIYGQRIRYDLALMGGEVAVCADAFDEAYPDVLYGAPAHRYYVIWEDRRNWAETGGDLYGRWLEADGSPATILLPFFRYAANQFDVAIAYDPDHLEGLGVWTDDRRTATDVYARAGALDIVPPVARFLRDPVVGMAGDTFTFDASPSRDNLTPPGALMVRWDLNNDGAWDTPLSLDKTITRTISAAGVYSVTLGVWDLMAYSSTMTLPVIVLPVSVNTPPTASISVSPLVGVAGTTFQFDASASSDAQTPNDLQVCWDWDVDGLCDTNFSATLTASRVYTDAGFHIVRAVVRDAGGLTDAGLQGLVVLPDAVTALEVYPWSVYMGPRENVWYLATAWDGYGNQLNNPPVTWTVTNPRAGVIDANGVFTSSTAPGRYPDVVLAETANGISDTASVRIVYPHTVYLPLILRVSP